MFNIQSVSIVSLLLGVFIIVLFYSVKNTKVLLYSILIFSIIFGIMINIYFIDGLLIIYNEIAHCIGENTGNILSKYQISVDDQIETVMASIVWAFGGLIFSLIFIYIVKYNKAILNILLMISLFLFQASFNAHPNIWVNIIMLLIGLLLSFKSYFYFTRDKLVIGKRMINVFFRSSFIIIIICSILILLLFLIKPLSEYEKNIYANKIEDYLTSKVENTRYVKGKIDSFPQGDFTKLSQLKLSGDLALEVIMDKPSSLYLRGFIGSQYTGDRWGNLDSNIYYENHGLFYWLNEEGFNSLNQLSILNDLKLGDETIGEKIKVNINNINANSKFLYTPYELSTNPNNFNNVNKYDDSMLMSTNYFGHRLYSYEINSNLVTQYPTLANKIYTAKEDTIVESYLKKENHYNNYVYKTYTQIPQHVRNILDSHIVIDVDEEVSHIPYESAIDYVRDHLGQILTYQIDPKPLPEGQDFIVHLLERSNEGYSVHYATAATLMFRYLGIPARYVEGYLVTPRDIKNKEPYEQIKIAGTNAHAWTEIYFDEIGWLPIEVTPPYFDVMEQTDLSDYPLSDPSEDTKNLTDELSRDSQDSQHITAQPDDKKTTSEDEDEAKQVTNWFKIFLSLLLLLIFGTYIVYLIINRMKVTKLKNSFNNPDLTVATKKLFAYTLKLLHHDGIKRRGGSVYSYYNNLRDSYGVSFANHFNEIVEINQKAIYSDKKITKEEYQSVVVFKDLTIAKVIKSKSILRKLKIYLWDFIY